jgi:hypothetical protein
MPIISTIIPSIKQAAKKRKKCIPFLVCVHISNVKDSNKLKGVAARKNVKLVISIRH